MLKKIIFIFAYLIANAGLHAAATTLEPIIKAKAKLDERYAFYVVKHRKIERTAAIVTEAVTRAEASGKLDAIPALKTKMMGWVSLIQSIRTSFRALIEKTKLAQEAMHLLIEKPSKTNAAAYNEAWAECVDIVKSLQPQLSEAEIARVELGKILGITKLLSAAAA